MVDGLLFYSGEEMREGGEEWCHEVGIWETLSGILGQETQDIESIIDVVAVFTKEDPHNL